METKAPVEVKQITPEVKAPEPEATPTPEPKAPELSGEEMLRQAKTKIATPPTPKPVEPDVDTEADEQKADDAANEVAKQKREDMARKFKEEQLRKVAEDISRKEAEARKNELTDEKLKELPLEEQAPAIKKTMDERESTRKQLDEERKWREIEADAISKVYASYPVMREVDELATAGKLTTQDREKYLAENPILSAINQIYEENPHLKQVPNCSFIAMKLAEDKLGVKHTEIRKAEDIGRRKEAERSAQATMAATALSSPSGVSQRPAANTPQLDDNQRRIAARLGISEQMYAEKMQRKTVLTREYYQQRGIPQRGR